MERRDREERARKREEVPLALRAARPHTVGSILVCDQEEGVVEYPLEAGDGAGGDVWYVW